jgi:hypothetical protein
VAAGAEAPALARPYYYAPPAYYAAPVYEDCPLVREPLYNRAGRVVAYRTVRSC